MASKNPRQHVRLLTQACRTQLDQLANRELKDDTTESLTPWAHEQRLRLNIFADVLGVFAAGKLSVEYRLRLNPNAKTVVLQLLGSILKNCYICGTSSSRTQDPAHSNPEGEQQKDAQLRELWEIALDYGETGGEDESWSSASGDSETSEDPGRNTKKLVSKETQQLLQQRISDDIGNLISFAALVRSSSSLRQDPRQEKYEPKDKEGNSLFPSFISSAQRALDRELSAGDATSADDFMRQRFVDTVVVRWRRLCFRNHRSKSLARAEPWLLENEEVSPHHTAPTTTAKEENAMADVSEAVQQANKPSTQTLSLKPSQKATTLAPTFDGRKDQARSQAPTASVTVAGNFEIEIPNPRNVLWHAGVHEFVCPLCQIPQSMEVTRRRFKQAWESVDGHVIFSTALTTRQETCLA